MSTWLTHFLLSGGTVASSTGNETPRQVLVYLFTSPCVISFFFDDFVSWLWCHWGLGIRAGCSANYMAERLMPGVLVSKCPWGKHWTTGRLAWQAHRCRVCEWIGELLRSQEISGFWLILTGEWQQKAAIGHRSPSFCEQPWSDFMPHTTCVR